MTSPELAVAKSGFGGRGYKHPLTGQIVPSVTTVLKMAAAPGLLQWAVDQTAAYAVANIDQLLTKTETQGYGSLRWYWKRDPRPLETGYDVRNYHQGVLNDAAELGTRMHEWAEADIDPACQYPDVSNEPDEFWQMVAAWDDWREQHTIKPILTETTVWNADEGYAGTFDVLMKIDGVPWLIDIKTSRSLWPDHLMQLGALKNATTVLNKRKDGSYEENDWRDALEYLDGIHYGFLHIRPDDITNSGDYLPAYVELVEAEYLDEHYEWFKGLLAAKKAEIAIGQLRKK